MSDEALPIYSNDEPALGSVPFTRYDPATGEILATGVCQRIVFDIERIQGAAILGQAATYGQDYVDLASKTIRPRQDWQPDVSGSLIRSLPIPCVLRIQGQEYTVDDGEADLSFDQPGVYTIQVESVSHLPREFEVVA